MKIMICCKKMAELLQEGYIKVNFAAVQLNGELGANFMGGGKTVSFKYCPYCGKEVIFIVEW